MREALVLLPQAQGRSLADAPAIERMLDAGAALSAMLAIVGPGARFMLSCGEEQACMATVLATDGPEEVTGDGRTPALALLAAHVSACLAGLERCVALDETSSAPLSARLH
ncbi:hypothetical protein WSK_0354 [Novosphingobium sp. Rr 2-17]|nr:hypothetical protein WSK_0354 [Novosphingobium sp. Rr 2-17]